VVIRKLKTEYRIPNDKEKKLETRTEKPDRSRPVNGGKNEY
jgi:hypothetical protein